MNAERRSRIDKLIADLIALQSEAEAIRDDEQDAYDAMPEGIQDSERGQKALEAIYNLDESCDAFDTMIDALKASKE